MLDFDIVCFALSLKQYEAALPQCIPTTPAEYTAEQGQTRSRHKRQAHDAVSGCKLTGRRVVQRPSGIWDIQQGHAVAQDSAPAQNR